MVVGGGFTSMDCARTSVRQGASEITLVYRRDMKDMPAANEVHEMIEEGARAIFQAAPVRVVTDATNKVTGMEFQRMALGAPDASGRRRPEPVAGTEFIIECDRVLLAIGQGPDLRGPRAARRAWAPPSSGASPRTRSPSPPAGPGVFGAGDVRTGAATVVASIAEGRRAAYAVDAYLKGMDLDAIKTRQTLAEPQPEFLSIVPYTSEVKEPRIRLKAMPAEARNRSYVEYEIPYTQQEAMAESARCLQCTCEAIGYCDLRRQGIEYGTTLKTLEPARTGVSFRSVSENRFTGVNHDYLRDDSHAFILREPSRCIDCGRCANVCKEVVGAACYDFMRTGFDTLVTTPLDMSLNTTPCVSCGRCAETCPTGALMPKPRVLEKYEVDESPLHPVRHLRGRVPLRRAALRARLRARPREPRGAHDRPHGHQLHRPRHGAQLRPPRARLAGPRPGRRPGRPRGPAAADAAARAPPTAAPPPTGTGPRAGGGGTHAHAK